MAFDERVIEEFRRQVYAKKVEEFVEAFEKVFDLAGWLEEYVYCLDDAGKKLLNAMTQHLFNANDAIDEFYWYFKEYLVKERDGRE